MKYKDFQGREIDTDKDVVICPYCHKQISQEDIENGEFESFGGGLYNEYGSTLFHEECAEKQEEFEIDNGYRK